MLALISLPTPVARWDLLDAFGRVEETDLAPHIAVREVNARGASFYRAVPATGLRRGTRLADWRDRRDHAAELYEAAGLAGVAGALREVGYAETRGWEIDDAYCAMAVDRIIADAEALLA